MVLIIPLRMSIRRTFPFRASEKIKSPFPAIASP